MGNLVGTLSGSSILNGTISAGVVDNTKIIQCSSIYEFPNRGDMGKIYIDTSENASYRWDEAASKYYCVGRDYQEIDTITGGTANG
ncbi:hypothetical protein AB840_09955 [Megasphaera cerevisiae DSM 20462]|uniref:Uncharacterized protein n=1 Tax=Megasphaera cerevisiae DSM 20462 TaxID=1122219 RepID=A0A0J6WU58_9FIRM|nr:hypothetical protein [Megasphaera cerevisiae]KMO86059.1 hypothetical protein AB840_09955 [Megasphaera cerevisiae DSM 20462]SKA01571.1 hypothetical protein SAMN05660900_02123 [Megasphaera cerevisiae DSM 20462]